MFLRYLLPFGGKLSVVQRSVEVVSVTVIAWEYSVKLTGRSGMYLVTQNGYSDVVCEKENEIRIRITKGLLLFVRIICKTEERNNNNTIVEKFIRGILILNSIFLIILRSSCALMNHCIDVI